MSSEKLYSEIFDEFNKCETKSQRIEVLRKYDSIAFRQFLIYALDPNIKFDVPLPDTYRPSIEPAGLNFTYLNMEVPKLYRFIEGHPKRANGLTPQKQTSLFRIILESLHKDEARLMVGLIQKDLKVKYLTVNLVKEAFNI